MFKGVQGVVLQSSYHQIIVCMSQMERHSPKRYEFDDILAHALATMRRCTHLNQLLFVKLLLVLRMTSGFWTCTRRWSLCRQMIGGNWQDYNILEY